jgi:glycosyltransferase involved in cell wall biosynthesis
MQNKKPIVLTFVRYYLPGYKSGGPVRTIANMVDHLGDNFEFRIITSDRDALDEKPYSGVDVDAWNQVGKADVYYASPNRRSARALAQLITDTPHDVLYLNSFFDPIFTLQPLLARRMGWIPKKPVVIAPRGEFSAGALALKWWKKKPYLAATRLIGLYRDLTWQASSEHEQADIVREMGRTATRILVAPNLPAFHTQIDVQSAPREKTEPLRIVFLSRISPMKNLDFALRVLGKVSVPVELHIFGGINDGAYWKSCQDLIHVLPYQVSVLYRGMIDHAVVHETLSKYDLFFLPTHGENYGHVIFEALSAGVPVLISDQTPWRDLDHEGVGYVRSLNDKDAFIKIIEQQFLLNVREREEQALKARHYAQRVAMNSSTIESNGALFLNLL